MAKKQSETDNDASLYKEMFDVNVMVWGAPIYLGDDLYVFEDGSIDEYNDTTPNKGNILIESEDKQLTNDALRSFRKYVVHELKQHCRKAVMYGSFVRFTFGNTKYEYYPITEKIIQFGYNMADNEEWIMPIKDFMKRFCIPKEIKRGLSNEEFLALLKSPTQL